MPLHRIDSSFCDTDPVEFELAEVATICGGTVLGEPSVAVEGASIDSRLVDPGALFVPIVGDRDGHDFIDDAMEAGAAAHLTERSQSRHPAVAVDDSVLALQALGSAARERITRAVVAITGSVGKTTTKDLVGAVVATRFRTHASPRSFNNELGVPLTLFGAPTGTEMAVVEMGARGPGHIALLCSIAQPDVGLVTRVGEAHTALFGSVEEVARAKGELVEALPRRGTAVLNADDHRVAAMAERTLAEVLTFGVEGGDVRAERIEVDDELRPRFSLSTPWGRVEVRLGLSGMHAVVDAAAAAAAGLAVGVGVDEVGQGLEAARPAPMRMQVSRSSSGALVLDDSYNANPMSMQAALDSIGRLSVRRRIAVLGIMAELGSEHEEAHRSIGDRARAEGIEVISVGVEHYGGRLVSSAEAAIGALEPMLPLGPDVAVLVKGSRVAGLEVVGSWLVDSG